MISVLRRNSRTTPTPAVLPHWLPIDPRDHACCCTGQPRFQIVLPNSDGEPGDVELLMCAHHYRVAAGKLADLGARVYDADGGAVPPPTTGSAAASEPGDDAAGPDHSRGLTKPAIAVLEGEMT